ncbi:hypothetical protein GLYMA_09G146600v4 [Glycine max]|uniref:Uncharacterized protein n=2 Tax=Glycine subgen. Soja TaxID=1462606 RepID=K7LDZ5_SOYBN|nr:hypothetical protein GYH30_025072 [Glycine max]KRH38608.1 hypothetical protein GLYMA_09G146600v4 [Glycine max]RZB92086.1 hypothetical protein D0Y65_024208 [Glycine soja]
MSHSNSIFHTALVVSNIKNHVSIILEMENVQYMTWAELFKPRFQYKEPYLHHSSNGECLSKSCLVIQLVSGLTSAYRGVGMLIQQSDHQPSFYQARLMLILEEAGSAMVATS